MSFCSPTRRVVTMIVLRRTSRIHLCMFHYVFRLCSSTSTSNRNSWDPTISLNLKHPTLILLEKCRSNGHFKQILAQMMRLRLITQTFPMSRLLYFCAVSHPENLNEAILLFKHFTPHHNLFIYNTMISALSFSVSESVNTYKSMLQSCIYPDEKTLLPLLKASNNFLVGKQTHVHVIISGFSSNAYLQNSLIKMYLENGNMDCAQMVFQLMFEKDIVSFNIMLSGYTRKGCCLKAIELFRDMVVSGIEPDQYTMVSLLMCCGQLKRALLGKSVHGWILRKMSHSNWGLILSNSLLDMYAKCEEMKTSLQVFNGLDERDLISWNILIAGFASIGELDLAYTLFDEMPCKDLVSWNSLLAGYARKGDCRRVMELFEVMASGNVAPDKVTAITLVSAATEMGVLNQGRCIHGWVVKSHGIFDAFLGSALIDMYCRCGSVERACVVFEMVSERDITLWTAMITGFAFHGHGLKALELFSRMQREGLAPNNVTLLAILTACSHAGLVDQSYRIFEDMKKIYSIQPGIEHYGCLIDVLARSGRLGEAKTVMEMMPVKPSPSMWGAILSSCKTHGDLELAETATRELIKLKPEEEGGYILLSNIYAASDRWSYSGDIRSTMESRGVKKMAGCSSVVVNGVLHDFYSSDKRHAMWHEIHFMLSNLQKEMRLGAEDSFKFIHQLWVPHMY